MSPHPTPSSSPVEHNLNKDKNACAKLSLHQRKHDFQLDEMQQPSRVNNQRENPIQSMHHKSFEFLKEQTQELISDNSSSKRGLTSYQIVNDWLQLLPMLSDRLRHEGTRLADVAVRESLRKYPDPSVLQLALEIIREWTRERDAEKGNSLLDYLDKEYGHLTDPNIVRDISLAYATVITAWANDTTDPDSLQRALHLFERSRTKSLEVHNAVLNAYGNRGMASEATKFLHDMQSRDTVVNPNVISFSIVMKAWTRSQQPDAQVHIDQMFDQLKELYEAQGCPVHLMPNDVTYAIAMTLAPPRRATALLQEMKSMYESTRNELVAPNVSHYIVVMKSWAKAGKPHEAKRLLAELISSYSSGNEKLRPMYECFVIVMDAFAKQNTLEGAQRAEELLNLMEQDFLERDGNATINNYAYNVVMDAYVRTSADSDKVEQILNRMMKIARDFKVSNLYPDKVSFTTLMRAWKAQGKPGNIAKIESLLHSMESSSDPNAHPDLVTYCVVLDALGKSGEAYSIARGQALLTRMRKRGIEPDRNCYNSILYAYTMTGNPFKARNLLQWMENEASRNGNELIRPEGLDYSTCIRAYAKKKGKKDERYFRQALSLFLVVKNRYMSGNAKFQVDGQIVTSIFDVLTHCLVPDKAKVAKSILQDAELMQIPFHTIIGNMVIRVCASETGSTSSAQSKTEALELAVVTFQRMKDGQIEVDSYTFCGIMSCCANLIGNEMERDAAIEDFFQICCEMGLVSERVVQMFRRLVPHSNLLKDFLANNGATGYS